MLALHIEIKQQSIGQPLKILLPPKLFTFQLLFGFYGIVISPYDQKWYFLNNAIPTGELIIELISGSLELKLLDHKIPKVIVSFKYVRFRKRKCNFLWELKFALVILELNIYNGTKNLTMNIGTQSNGDKAAYKACFIQFQSFLERFFSYFLHQSIYIRYKNIWKRVQPASDFKGWIIYQLKGSLVTFYVPTQAIIIVLISSLCCWSQISFIMYILIISKIVPL